MPLPDKNRVGEGLYPAIKKVIHRLFSAKVPELSGDLDEPSVSLCFCWRSTDAGVEFTNPQAAAVTIALHVEAQKGILSKFRIPSSVSARSFSLMEELGARSLRERRSPLTKVEADYEGNFSRWRKEYDRLGKGLVEDVNKYSRGKAGIPKFYYECGCGEGEVEVKITTKPSGATVKYIPLFSYLLCEAQSVDANDSDKCAGWITAVSVTEDLIGKYHFVATWPDGGLKRGILTIGKRGDEIEIRR